MVGTFFSSPSEFFWSSFLGCKIRVEKGCFSGRTPLFKEFAGKRQLIRTVSGNLLARYPATY